jgi:mRNA-degrading endonuclease RelE of RelBE toxin-antitoxin system
MAGPYEIRFTTEAIEDIGALRAHDRTAVREEIRRHLSHEPTRVSRSRIKEMQQPFWSQYRLRIGELRAYYDVDEAALVIRINRVLRKGSQPTLEESP